VSEWQRLFAEVSELDPPPRLRDRILSTPGAPGRRDGSRRARRGVAWVLSICGALTLVAALALAAHSRRDESGAPPSTGSGRSTLIVPTTSIGGVAIGERRTDVEHLVGAGNSRTNSYGATYVHYDAYGLTVVYDRGLKINGTISNDQLVVQVSTTSPRFRTRSGVGVGSTLAMLKHVAPVVCTRRHHRTLGEPQLRGRDIRAKNGLECALGTTAFFLIDRKIDAIRLAALVTADGRLVPPNPELAKTG
jgi:hypothetical protein